MSTLSKPKSELSVGIPRLGVGIRKLEEGDYRRIIVQLQNELNAKDARLRGVYSLTQMLHDAEGQCKLFAEKSNNYEQLLRRAEARIAQLNKFYGIGPQTAFNKGVIMPGVSKKDFDLVSQENIKLKNALDHIGSGTSERGHEIVRTNKELSDLVSNLRKAISDKDNHIKMLENTLRTTTGLSVVPDLQRKVMHLEELLESKQLFCETLIKDLDQLRNKEEEQSSPQEAQGGQDLVDGRQEKMDEIEHENAKLKEAIEKLKEENSLLKTCENEFNAQKSSMTELQEKLELLEAELHSQSELLDQGRKEKQQFIKEHAELKKKCDAFYKQVGQLTAQEKTSEEQLSRMQRAFDHQKAEVEEKKGMIQLMTESLKSYEDDFRRENEEKAKYQKISDKAQQETERYKRENMSHIATMKHLEDEYERLSKMLTDERQRSNASQNNYRTGPGMGGTRSLFTQPDSRRGIIVSDGGGRDEFEGRRQEPASMPVTKTETSSSPSLIECPYCSRSYPYHLIESHVSDCMEENLHLDDKD